MNRKAVEAQRFKIDEVFDPRGGWNRYKFNVDFFKKWSNEVAYVLGFLYADGDIEDADASSRTRYIAFASKDREIIEKIKAVLKSEHPIHFQPPRTSSDKYGHIYKSSGGFRLRIGSKRVFSDLIKLGLIPQKSKVIKFPFIPMEYLGHFLRGYFDGDGTFYIEQRKGINQRLIFKRSCTILCSGSKVFLKDLSAVLAKALNLRSAKIYKGNREFRIVYFTKESVKIFKFMYKNSTGLLLKRKFDNFKRFFNIRPRWLDKEITENLNENAKYLAT